MTAARNHRPDSGKTHAMKSALVKHRATKPDLSGLSRVLPQVRALIEMSRQQVVTTANLTLVWLYWNVERVISAEIQRHAKRAEYGEGLLEVLGTRLTKQYGNGFSARSLWDMRRFFTDFRILPAPAAESGGQHILPSLLAESQVSPIRQLLADKSGSSQILQPVAGKSSVGILPLAAAESEDRIIIDFSKHHRVGWTHYRILLGVEAGLKRGFYFDQAAQQRWTSRELHRQIDRALFERVALSGQRGCPHRYPQALVG